MTTPESITRFETWLTALPGGRHIAPHWQDGPYWLVPVDTTPANMTEDCKRLLEAHDPLTARLPVHNGWNYETYGVYAVSQFVYEWLLANQDDVTIALEQLYGPFEQRPTVSDLRDVLPDMLDLRFDRDEFAPGAQAAALRAMAVVDPDNLLVALRVLSEDPKTCDDETAVLRTVMSAAAVA